jgi:hypothetical protein
MQLEEVGQERNYASGEVGLKRLPVSTTLVMPQIVMQLRGNLVQADWYDETARFGKLVFDFTAAVTGPKTWPRTTVAECAHSISGCRNACTDAC